MLLCFNCHNNAPDAPHNSRYGEQPFLHWFAKKYPEWNKEIDIKRASKTRKLDMKAVYQELKNWRVK
jgi:hypothetical protein